jgi:putative transcriptional regulator
LLGYAGWGPGQLEREMTEGTWLLAPIHPDILFETPADEIYDSALATLGINRADLAAGNTSIN